MGDSLLVRRIECLANLHCTFQSPRVELLGDGHIEDLVIRRLETPQSRALEKKREHHDGHDGCTPSGS
jgi:hypothetical protein